MKNERLRVFLIILLFLLILTGCKSQNIVGGKMIAGPAAADVVNYVNQGLIGIAELERRSLESYASVTGENYISDQRVYEELKNFIVPIYKRFLDGLHNIAPKNEVVRRVHVIYIQAAESMYDGFRTKMVGIENNDENIIIQGNQKIEKGRMGIEKWRSELNELYKEQGVAEIIEK